jgi:hypothetical protein
MSFTITTSGYAASQAAEQTAAVAAITIDNICVARNFISFLFF